MSKLVIINRKGDEREITFSLIRNTIFSEKYIDSWKCFNLKSSNVVDIPTSIDFFYAPV